MQDEINKIIEKHLPEQTAAVMKEFIKEAETVKSNLETADAVIRQHEKVIADYKKKDAEYDRIRNLRKQMDDRRDGLDVREDEITKRENQSTVIESNTRMEMMRQNMENMKALVDKVFGHPSVSITRQVPVVTAGSYTDQNGNYRPGDFVEDKSSTETKVEGKE